MTLVSNPSATRLAHREILRLRDRNGDRIECVDGSVWITQDGDPRDVVLDAGESFTLDRVGTALIYALANARVAVRSPAAAQALHIDASRVQRTRDLIPASGSTA